MKYKSSNIKFIYHNIKIKGLKQPWINKVGPSLKTVILKVTVFMIRIRELVLGLGASLEQARSKPFIFYFI